MNDGRETNNKKPLLASRDKKNHEEQDRVIVLDKALFTTNRLLYCTAEELNINSKVNLIGGVIDQWSPPTKNLFNNVSDLLFHRYLQGYFENIYYKNDLQRQSLKPSKTFLSENHHLSNSRNSSISKYRFNNASADIVGTRIRSPSENRNNPKTLNRKLLTEGKSFKNNNINKIGNNEDILIKTISPEPFRVDSINFNIQTSKKFLSRKEQRAVMASTLSSQSRSPQVIPSVGLHNMSSDQFGDNYNLSRTSTSMNPYHVIDNLSNSNLSNRNNNDDNMSTINRTFTNTMGFLGSTRQNKPIRNLEHKLIQVLSSYKPGELISIQKMLVQVNLIDESSLVGVTANLYSDFNENSNITTQDHKNITQTNYQIYHHPCNGSVNNKIFTDFSLYDARIRDRWKEYYVVIRKSHGGSNPDTPLTFEFLKDRTIKRFSSPSENPPLMPASSLGASNFFRNGVLDFELCLSKCSINFYNYLDKSICISVPESAKERYFTSPNYIDNKFVRLYIFKSISLVESVDWYLFLKSFYVSLSTRVINVFIPSLELDVTIEVPLETYENFLKQSKKRKVFILEFKNNNYNYKVSTPTNYIIHIVLQRLKDIQQNFPVIKQWFETINNNSTKIGLAWKYFDRLEWIIDVNQNLVSQYFALDFNSLVLEIISNYPTTVRRGCKENICSIYRDFYKPLNVNNDDVATDINNDEGAPNAKQEENLIDHAGLLDSQEINCGMHKIMQEPTPIEGFLKIVPSKNLTDYCLPDFFCTTDNSNSFKYFFTSRELLLFTSIKHCSPPILQKYNDLMKLSDLQYLRKSKSFGNLKLNNQVENKNYQFGNPVSNLEIPDNYIQSLFELTSRGEIEWLNNDNDLNYYDGLTISEIKRQTFNIYKAEGILKLCDISKIEATEIENRFRIKLENGSDLILETKNRDTRDLWIDKLKILKKYWKLRADEDLRRLISCREYNLKKIDIKESEEVNFVNNSLKWELKKGRCDPKIYNINHITLLKVIIKSGELYRKLRKHGNFEKYYVVLIPGYLVIYEMFQRKMHNDVVCSSPYYKRLMKVPLRNCYLYSGNLTNQDLLQKDRNFDIQNPGNHVLPKIYGDGWKSSEDEASRCFTLWVGAKRLIINKNYYSEENIKSISSPKYSKPTEPLESQKTSSSKSTMVKLVNRLGREGTNIVFMARSRQEKDLWTLSILNEIGRFNYMAANEFKILENNI